MTVAELIEQLKKFDQSLEVFVEDESVEEGKLEAYPRQVNNQYPFKQAQKDWIIL